MRTACLAAIAASSMMMVAGSALAQDRAASNPPELRVLRGMEAQAFATAPHAAHFALSPFAAVVPATPPERTGNEALLTLDVNYAFNRIWNPVTARYDVVRLRSYNGSLLQQPQDANEWKTAPLLVGPTIRLNPSETVRITLNNKLPDDACVAPQGTHDIPHCFNVTNLHGHGLHVSPVGNGDNVLLEIRPGQSFQYEYNIAADHPAGTFWYHAHRHGSTALQVSSGMAGALIIRGDRKPELTPSGALLPGDLDTLLVTPVQGSAPVPFPERVLLFEQIQYACRDQKGGIRTTGPQKPDAPWTCAPNEADQNPVGGVEGYDQFGPGTWGTSGRFTLVNGLLQPMLSLGDGPAGPVVNATVGRPERWRMIHAGVRDTIKLAIVKAMQPPPSGAAFATLEQRRAYTAAACSGPVVTQWTIAQDGLTQAQIVPISTIEMGGRPVTIPTVLQPGYRADIIVVFPEEGDYCVMDEAAAAPDTVAQASRDRRLLATVHADGSGGVPADKAGLTRALVDAANAVMPPSIRQRVVDDLNADLKLTAFVPHPTIPDDEVEGHQELTFSIDLNSPSPSNPQLRFGINHQGYSPDRIDRELKLDSADEWFLTSTLAAHPFHIHVNPFQVVRILKQVQTADAQGKTVTEWKDLTDPAIDYATRLGWETVQGTPDPEYLNLKGVWKDTLFTKQGYRIYVRSRYERYIGDFVLHCHILDHEDQGMMENVRVSLTGASIMHDH
ncbi:MAG: multicopper oxidase domain-containing protein [Mycobacterium sp.]|nr:multicopper oxidase domain-containing protein [Mycobacterium sp.]